MTPRVLELLGVMALTVIYFYLTVRHDPGHLLRDVLSVISVDREQFVRWFPLAGAVLFGSLATATMDRPPWFLSAAMLAFYVGGWYGGWLALRRLGREEGQG
jgi:hypothetical protein